ncbi:MAG: hypothetical protein IH960_06845 [Chloroflexi bacterium]|nr:hypothetical protein [Chloroflexota bacterium]
MVIASADHWNLKLRIPNAANGATLVRGNRVDAEAVAEVEAGDDEIGVAAREPDVSPLELPDPSATIYL